NPPSIRDYLRPGLAGWAMSRSAGGCVGFRWLTETGESAGTRTFGMDDAAFGVPQMAESFARFRAQSPTLEARFEEEAVVAHRLEAARAFARHNRIDRAVWQPAQRRLALVTVGKAHVDTLQAFADLGID